MGTKPYFVEGDMVIEEDDPLVDTAKHLVVFVLWTKAKKTANQFDDFVVRLVAKVLRVDLPT
jgi:hypothetical protein